MAKNENSNFSYMTRRIGGTTYKVKVVFSDTEKETMENKILRMIRNETVTTGGTCDIEEFPNPYNWSGYIVGQILSKPEYMGHTVNFRSHKQSYKDKNPVMNPQEEWLIFENTHEAIIDKETWELVQKLRKTPRRKDTFGEANP